MENIIITDHARGRIKERVGIKSQHEKEAFAMKAYYEGLREDDCTGVSLKLIQSCKKDEFWYRELVLYRDQIYVFEGQTLITVLSLDSNYLKIMDKNRCKRNKRNKKVA